MDKYRRQERMVAGGLGVVALLALGLSIPVIQWEEDPAQYAGWAGKYPPVHEVPIPGPMTADEHVQTLLPTLFYDDEETRDTGLKAIAMAFDGAGADEISAETRDETAAALVELYVDAGDAAEEAPIREAAIRLMVTKVKGETARAFAAQVLEAEPAEMQVAVLKALLTRGAIRGGEVYDLAYELAKGDSVPDALKPALLRRIKGKKAEADIVELMTGKLKPVALRHCAVELQNLHKPELMGGILARLDEEGLLDDTKTMPWFSGKLLSRHIAKAEGEDLIRALRVVWKRPSLTRSTFKAVEERLAHADPMIRRMAARLVPDAVKYEGIDLETGENLLSARLQVETDPAVKGQIEGSLTEVRRTRRAPVPVPAESTP